jgi:hypothetical protein
MNRYFYIQLHEHISLVWCGDAMRWPYILVFLLLCAVISPAVANDPVNLGATLSKDWIIADGIDTSTLTITVTDGVNKPIAGADILISVEKAPWNVRDTALKTDSTGTAQTLFLPTTQSGTATITVSASVPNNAFIPGPRTLTQKIDAGTPYVWKASYPSVGSVASFQNISVRISDRNGNPVTSLRLPNAVGFVTTGSGSGGFLDREGNLAKSVSVALNDTGYASTTLRLDTKAGDNYVMIRPPVPLIQTLITIEGIGNGIPYSIIQSVSPPGNPPYIMANLEDQATIDYYLYDEWGNPSTDQEIFITTSAGEDLTFSTNQEGRASLTYGPKQTAGLYTIVATAVENKTVSVVQTLQFVSGDPTDMILTASPQTMPSRDVNKGIVGRVIAKVIDEKGNPVKGETVTFQMEKSVSDPSQRTWEPAIEYGGSWTNKTGVSIPIKTDVDGLAVLNFYPGAFPLLGEPHYNANSQGTVKISAAWGAKKGAVVRTIDLSYKNYPFLSVYTDVIPRTVQVGNRVDVSVRLKGDGWALQPKPIDVILLTDRSATMLYNSSVSTGRYVEELPGKPTLNDRMVDAMRAGVTFVEETRGKEDRIGVVSFGSPPGGIAALYDTGQVDTKYISIWGYRAGRDFKCNATETCRETILYKDTSDDGRYVDAHYPGHTKKGKDYRVNGVEWPVYVESPFLYVTTDKTRITNAINSMVPSGGTNMRQALYEGVRMFLDDPGKRAGSVKAIILLSDGRWNVGGDPTGVDQSIFTATTYPEISSMKGPGSVVTWAKDNNIKIFTIALLGSDPDDQPNLEQLRAYADETGGEDYVAASGLELGEIYRRIAGELREEASIDTKVTLDFENIEVNNQIAAGGSVLSYVPIPDRSTYIVPPAPLPPEWRDDSAVWGVTQKLNFDPGTIKVNQEWRMNVTFQPNTEGNIKVLSSQTSKVTFVGTVGSVDIPDTFITAIPVGTERGPQGISFAIHFADPARRNEESDTKIASLRWKIDYDVKGRDPSISQQIWVAPIYSEAYQYKETIVTPRGEDTVDYNLVISDLRPGLYKVKVIGHVSDANDASDIATFNIPEDLPDAKIKIGSSLPGH